MGCVEGRIIVHANLLATASILLVVSSCDGPSAEEKARIIAAAQADDARIRQEKARHDDAAAKKKAEIETLLPDERAQIATDALTFEKVSSAEAIATAHEHLDTLDDIANRRPKVKRVMALLAKKELARKKWDAEHRPVERLPACTIAAERFIAKMESCGLNMSGITEERLCSSIDTVKIRFAASRDCQFLLGMISAEMHRE